MRANSQREGGANVSEIDESINASSLAMGGLIGRNVAGSETLDQQISGQQRREHQNMSSGSETGNVASAMHAM